jgi:hypothetical protein
MSVHPHQITPQTATHEWPTLNILTQKDNAINVPLEFASEFGKHDALFSREQSVSAKQQE